MHGIGDWDTQLGNSLESAVELADYAKSLNLILLIENHGGLSSNADWLLQLLQQANNFKGYHSVEYEGGEKKHLSIDQGIIKTLDLLKRVWHKRCYEISFAL